MRTRGRPDHVEEAMIELRQVAHERVLGRGLVQFRLERDYMQQLLEMADEKGLGYGVLARMWLCERLEQERLGSSKLPLNQIRKIIRQEVQEALKIPQPKRKKAV